MNLDNEQQLEQEIDRELKRLPELQAPSTLIARVLRVLEPQARLPWYHRSWATWPLGLQIVSLLVLVGSFAAICLAADRLPQSPEYALASHKASGWLALLNLLWNTLTVILGALVLAIKRLGAGFLAGCLASLALGYAMCVGLGTLYLRIGFARRARI